MENGKQPDWISVEDEPMPIEQFILVAHPNGIEAINFHSAQWRYWYSSKPISDWLLQNITHWMRPQHPKA